MIKTNYIEPNEGFSQAVITEANNIKTIYISGQIVLVPLKQNYRYISNLQKKISKL
jgi:enamine deaminase RidA (YjgF/YER057c/UK114 family)